jgi:hypothetical protein
MVLNGLPALSCRCGSGSTVERLYDHSDASP